MSEINHTTAGFYKKEGDILIYAPNEVINKDYNLKKENKDLYQYPIDGWIWFNSEIEAKYFLKIDDTNKI